MHKVVLILTTLLSLLFHASSANALSIEGLVKWCKPFANRGFQPQTPEDVYCITTVKTVIESYHANCTLIGRAKERGVSVDPTLLNVIASGKAPLNAANQAFLSWAEDNPAFWEVQPSGFQSLWLSANWPCED